MKKHVKKMSRFVKQTQASAVKLKLGDGEVVEALLLMYSTIAMMHDIPKEKALEDVNEMLSMVYGNKELVDNNIVEQEVVH